MTGKEIILIEALQKIRDTAKEWAGRTETPYWNLGDIAAAALKRAEAQQSDAPAESLAEADWLAETILPEKSSIAIAMLNYGFTHAESWLFSPTLRPDLTLAVGQVAMAVLPPVTDGGQKVVIIGKIKELNPAESGDGDEVTLIPIACRGPVVEHTGQSLGDPVVVNDIEIYRVLDAAYWFGGKVEAENA
ncbi:MAG: hypothetical protein FOGNACKC_06191 [Anaerolineae bacterium]|nr:hypothetical protein [Anaerolineae bacterium]